MAVQLADRVQELSSSIGTGAFTLDGSIAGYQTFNAAFGVGPSFYYCITGGSSWEIGIGVLGSVASLTRSTVLASSNSGSAVNFDVGNKLVFCPAPAYLWQGLWDRNQRVAVVTLTDTTNIATDASLSNNFQVTLAGNRTLDNPTNLQNGMVLNWAIAQDATGSRTLAYGTKFDFGGVTPVLSLAAGAVDLISGYYHAGADKILCSFRKDS